MVNGQKSDMEHKNTNDKNEYHFQLPEVVVKGKMPGWMRKQLGMVLHRNPALFRKCMKNATSLEEEQFYFNLAFNAAREEASQQFVQAALTAAGIISAISTAGASLSAATLFGRKAALLGRGALLKGSVFAGRIASSIEVASLSGKIAVQNVIMRSATHLRTLSNITGRMLYPNGLSFDTMLLMGGTDFTLQWGGNTIYKYTEENKTFINSMYESLNDINIVSTLSSSMKLPYLCSAVLSSSLNINLKGKTKTIFDGGISTHEFLIDLGFGIGLGKVENNTYSNFFKNNTSKIRQYIPNLNEPSIQRILRNLHKYGDGTIDAMDKTIISLWGTYYTNEAKKIGVIKNDTIRKKK